MRIVRTIKHICFMSLFLLLNNHCALGSSVIEEESMSKQTQERLLNSPFNALLHRNDGKMIMAYLYAEDERSSLSEGLARHNAKPYSTIAKIGHFKIYLYDVGQKVFLPGSTSVFKKLEGRVSFNEEGSEIIVLPGGEGKSDVLLIGQFGTERGNFYEAYGFSADQLSLENYIFAYRNNKKDKQFFGRVGGNDKDATLTAFEMPQDSEIGGVSASDLYMSVSKRFGEINLDYLNEESE